MRRNGHATRKAVATAWHAAVMTDSSELSIRPGHPSDFGVADPELPIEKIEPARLLANAARERLSAAGLSDPQIDDWAEAFFAVHPEGGTDELIAWIQAAQTSS
jgi:hypothetical protein